MVFSSLRKKLGSSSQRRVSGSKDALASSFCWRRQSSAAFSSRLCHTRRSNSLSSDSGITLRLRNSGKSFESSRQSSRRRRSEERRVGKECRAGEEAETLKR